MHLNFYIQFNESYVVDFFFHGRSQAYESGNKEASKGKKKE
jgi:hypothetical protein